MKSTLLDLQENAELKAEARERKLARVVRLAADGMCTKEIAQRLRLRPSIVRAVLAMAGIQPQRGGGLPHGLPWG